MKAKKLTAMLLAASMTVAMVGCGNGAGDSAGDNGGSASTGGSENAAVQEEEPAGDSEAPKAGGTLEIAVTYTGNEASVFKTLVEDFEAESGYTVNVAEYGEDYEATLKTRMASNDLPDIFQTHGWSLLRYKEYLMQLNDQPWVSDYDESALGVIQDDDDSIYVLMISELINGTLVNLDICEQAGVDPYSIHTWDDFTEACEKIKAAGYTANGTNAQAGVLANPSGTWTTYEGELAQDSAAMLDGSWNWDSYEPMLKKYAEWMDAGYYYEDVLSMKDNDFTERFASDKAAFILGYDPSILLTCLTLNAEGNYAFLPHFASKEGGKEFIGIGEGDSFGIWKDTKNADAAKAFLEYMARPEVANKMNEASGKLSCLKSTMEIDESYGLQCFQTMKEKCADCDLLYENLWDRQYMPSGMWPIFENATTMLFDDHSEGGVQATKDYLVENYNDLYEAAQTE